MPIRIAPLLATLCALLLGGAISGCATLKAFDVATPVAAGDAAARPPSLRSRLGHCAIGALRSPVVWAPSAAALLLQVDGCDRRLSDWARRETPVFGSQTHAQEGSDVLLASSVIEYAAVFAITPGPAGPGPWLRDKSVRGAAGLGALAANAGITSLAKVATGRERPDGSDDLSFPSGHASGSATSAALAAGEAQRLPGPPWVRSTLALGGDAIAASCGWARVEAGKHYPSDVLVGWSLGTAFGLFTNAAMTPRAAANGSPAASLWVGRHGVRLALTIPLR